MTARNLLELQKVEILEYGVFLSQVEKDFNETFTLQTGLRKNLIFIDFIIQIFQNNNNQPYILISHISYSYSDFFKKLYKYFFNDKSLNHSDRLIILNKYLLFCISVSHFESTVQNAIDLFQKEGVVSVQNSHNVKLLFLNDPLNNQNVLQLINDIAEFIMD